MDSQFLEFWGNFFIQAANGQRQLEDMAKWMRQGMKGAGDVTDMFRKAYGLDSEKDGMREHRQSWEKAAGDFKSAFEDWLQLMGMVPMAEHRALVEKYEALKKKNKVQQDVIERLQGLLEEKGHATQNEVKNFQDLMQQQSDQFRQLMEGIGRAFQKEGSDG